MVNSTHRVFVYGTLKRGFPNAEGMNGAQFLGRFRTCDPFPLVIAGQWYTPVMLPERGTGHRVLGELYAVGDDTLAALDRLESTHLPTGYTREEIPIESLEDASIVTAWTYFKERSRVSIIHSEYLGDYQDRRYIPLSQRTAR
jgi:gamma-glutamylaminecyclotransferase